MKTSRFSLTQSVIVQEYETGLLFRDGQFVQELKPGKHEFKTEGAEPNAEGGELTVKTFDLRVRSMVVQGQEVLSSDQITLKVSAVATYCVADALKLYRSVDVPESVLHAEVQLALRQVIGTLSAEQFLTKKSGFGAELKALLEQSFAIIGLRLERADIRDVMLPPELKRAYTDAFKSKQEAHASLEKARAETAALRTLANAAKLMRENPELLSLRYLQTLQEVGAGSGNTLVLGLTEAAALANRVK